MIFAKWGFTAPWRTVNPQKISNKVFPLFSFWILFAWITCGDSHLTHFAGKCRLLKNLNCIATVSEFYTHVQCLPCRVYLFDLLGWCWCSRSWFIFMLILSLTPHRGMFIILTVISSSSPVWLRPAKAWNSMMWAFRPSRLSKFALLWEWWWSISSIYPYFIRYICNKSTAIEKRKPQKISYENWMVWIFRLAGQMISGMTCCDIYD